MVKIAIKSELSSLDLKNQIDKLKRIASSKITQI